MSKYENCRIPRLFELMDELKITAATFSRDLKISKGNVTDWKMGRATPSKLALSAIADYLNTTPEYLLGETNDRQKETTLQDIPEGLSELDTEIIKIYASLPEEKKQQALSYLEFLRKTSQGDE